MEADGAGRFIEQRRLMWGISSPVTTPPKPRDHGVFRSQRFAFPKNLVENRSFVRDHVHGLIKFHGQYHQFFDPIRVFDERYTTLAR